VIYCPDDIVHARLSAHGPGVLTKGSTEAVLAFTLVRPQAPTAVLAWLVAHR